MGEKRTESDIEGDDDTTPAKETRIEVDLSTGRIRADNIWDDFLPAIKPGVKTLGNVLGVAASLSGLTAEVFNDAIEFIRNKYRAGVGKIPTEHRKRPSFRITNSVLSESVNSVDEPALRDLFANLLVTASDDRRTDESHPGFAKAIGQLTAFDAKMIEAMRDRNSMSFHRTNKLWPGQRKQYELSVVNLVQLGIAEWVMQRPNTFFKSSVAEGFKRVRVKLPVVGSSGRSFSRGEAPEGLDDAARAMAEKTVAEIEKTQKRDYLHLTEYGKLFASACLDPQASAESQPLETDGAEDPA